MNRIKIRWIEEQIKLRLSDICAEHSEIISATTSSRVEPFHRETVSARLLKALLFGQSFSVNVKLKLYLSICLSDAECAALTG